MGTGKSCFMVDICSQFHNDREELILTASKCIHGAFVLSFVSVGGSVKRSVINHPKNSCE